MTGLEFLKELFHVGELKKPHCDTSASRLWKYGNLKVAANTKSEARAKLKKIVGTLPVGAGNNIKITTRGTM